LVPLVGAGTAFFNELRLNPSKWKTSRDSPSSGYPLTWLSFPEDWNPLGGSLANHTGNKSSHFEQKAIIQVIEKAIIR
jgi:hypothetical protein